MSETLTAPEETSRPHEMIVQGNQLHNAMFGIEEPVKTPEQQAAEQKPVETTPTQEVETKKEEPVVVPETKQEEDFLDEDKYVKEKWGWDNADAGKKELETLRERAAALELTNEESKKILAYLKDGKKKELYQFLHEQEQVEKLISSDLSDEKIASELVKFNIANKNKNLTKEEVDFLFNKKFSIPKEPVQKADELDEDFEARKSEWQVSVSNAKRELIIEAKLAQPELEKLKAQLILPDIKPQVQERQLTQEELDAAKKYDEVYIKSVDESLKGFNGFSVKVKNEAVGLPETTIAYAAVDAEKSLLLNDLTDFAKKGYNSNALFAERWVNDDGTLKTAQIIEDRYLLANKEKIFQKLSEEAANKAIDAYIKSKKQIDIKQTQQQGTAVINKEDKTDADLIRDQFFS